MIPSHIKHWRHVDWLPGDSSGLRWIARVNGVARGYVKYVRPGVYEARPFGGVRRYVHDIHDGAKRVVAYINNVSPSLL